MASSKIFLITVLVTALGAMIAALTAVPSEANHEILITAFSLLGACAGVLVLAVPLDQISLLKLLAGRFWVATALFCATLLALVSYFAGMRQIGGFDHSVLIDVAWRMYSGQHPYVDFPLTLPFVHYMGGYYAFLLFGPQWKALVIFNALIGFLTFLWLVFLCRRLFIDSVVSLVLPMFCQAVTTTLTGYWWYNSTTSIVSVVFLFSAVAWYRGPKSPIITASLLLSAVILLGAKPNVGAPLLIGCFVSLLLSSEHRVRAAVIAIASLGVAMALASLHGIQFTDMVASYWSVSSRGMSSSQFLQDLGPVERISSLLCLAYVVAHCVHAARGGFSDNPVPGAMALCGVFAGLIGFVTNGEIKFVDLPLILCGAILFVCRGGGITSGSSSPSTPAVDRIRGLVVLAAVLVFIGVGLGVSRQRVKAIGYGAFFQYAPLQQVPANEFFDGVSASPRLISAVAEIRSALGDVGARPGKVFFGPRMQWAYAAFGLQSPRGEPVWWHPGVSFPSDDESFFVEKWADANHDLLIFLKNDATYLSPQFLQVLSQRYDIDDSFPTLTICRLRTNPQN